LLRTGGGAGAGWNFSSDGSAHCGDENERNEERGEEFVLHRADCLNSMGRRQINPCGKITSSVQKERLTTSMTTPTKTSAGKPTKAAAINFCIELPRTSTGIKETIASETRRCDENPFHLVCLAAP